MIRSEYEARIGTHYLSALINGDESGLSEADQQELQLWLDQFDGSVDICIDESDDGETQESFFGRCDICGLHADVVDVTVLVSKTAGA